MILGATWGRWGVIVGVAMANLEIGRIARLMGLWEPAAGLEDNEQARGRSGLERLMRRLGMSQAAWVRSQDWQSGGNAKEGVGRDQLEAVAQEEGWKSYFEVRGRFMHNEAVMREIWRQRGWDATDVTSASNWRDLGYVPKPEAGGFEVDGQRYYREGEMDAQRGAKSIWPPDAPLLEGEVDHHDIEDLVGVLQGAGWEVRWEKGDHGEVALTWHSEKQIFIEPGASGLVTLDRLAHEAGHALMHHGGQGGLQWEREVEAQSFAWAWVAEKGYDISPYASDYILTWAKGRPTDDLVYGERVEAALERTRQEVAARQAELTL
jgi:hypothetical protein